MRRSAPLLILLLAAAVPAGCGGCDDDPSGKVPFRQGDNGAHPPANDHPDEGFEPAVSRALPEGTRKVAVEGAPLEVAGGSIRALLPLDVDGDGDRDVLLIRAGDDGGAAVEFARRDDGAFAKVSPLGSLAAPREGCQVSEASLRTLSSAYGVLSVARHCAVAPGSAAPPPEHTLGILGLGDTPRLLERMTLLPPEGRTPADVTLALQTTDVDDDGHEDVVLEVGVVAPGEKEPVRIRLPWLDRPSGLARDTSEPEKTLADLADQARKALGTDPDAALATARRVLTAHGVLCRESDGARLQFGDGGGLTCGRSAAAGRAAAVLAAALAQKGQFFDALDAEERLSQPGYAVTAAERKLIGRAWARAPVPDGLTWRKVASHHPGAMPDVHLPAVSFTDANTLLLRGASPQVVDLRTGEARPAPEVTDPGLLRDPSGELAVVDVHRSCEGYELSIVRAQDVVAGVVAGRPVSKPLLEPKAPPTGARCPELPAAAAADDGGWVVLGWAPQGVVAVRGATIRVVPLTVDGRPAGEPTVLDPGTPPPAPLPRGQATPDAQAYVLASPHGVLLRELGAEGRTLLLRPDGWAKGDTAPTDVAIAPDASRVAVLRDGDVWVIEGVP